MKITRELLRRWGAYYDDLRIAALVPEDGLTPLEVAALDIPEEDRLLVLLREDFIPARELRLLACDWAEAACRKAGWNDERSHTAIAVARRHADGEASESELAEAASAAWAAAEEVVAAWAAAEEVVAARAAAWSADRSAERSARLARSAAEAAEARGLWAALAAWSDALASARAEQLADVVRVLRKIEGGTKE